MAWIYLAESEDSALPYDLGSNQSPIVKKIDTHRAYSCPECGAKNSIWHLFGMTSLRSPHLNCFHVTLTLSMADFHARTSVLQELEKAWTLSEVDFISKSIGSQKKQSLNSFFSKMYLQLELGDLIKSSILLPISGMIADGQLFQPLKLVPSTFVNDGSFLPTPTASDYGKNNGRNSKDPEKSRDRWSLTVRARRGNLPHHSPGKLNPQWLELAMGYPLSWTEIEPWAMRLSRGKQERRL